MINNIILINHVIKMFEFIPLLGIGIGHIVRRNLIKNIKQIDSCHVKFIGRHDIDTNNNDMLFVSCNIRDIILRSVDEKQYKINMINNTYFIDNYVGKLGNCSTIYISDEFGGDSYENIMKVITWSILPSWYCGSLVFTYFLYIIGLRDK